MIKKARSLFLKIGSFLGGNRLILYLIAVVLLAALSFYGQKTIKPALEAEARFGTQTGRAQELIDVTLKYRELQSSLGDVLSLYPEINIDAQKAALPGLRQLILNHDVAGAAARYEEIWQSYKALMLEEAKKQELTGSASYQNSFLGQTEIQIWQNNQQLKTIKTGDDGKFRTWLLPGLYQLRISLSGYSDYSADLNIVKGQPLDLTVALSKPITKTATKPATVAQTPVSDGIYSKISVNTDRGTFTVHLLTIDLSQYTMIVDTAAEGDCANDCPVKSLSSFVSDNGGVAGLNGTYFCPTSYAECAGQTNTFYFKLVNGRNGNKINWNNGLGNYLPFLTITPGGVAKYYKSWSSGKDSAMTTALSCRPHLVEDSQVVLQASDLDSPKESTDKISHGFIGIKGQTIYAGIVLSATLYDSAAVSHALGFENSFNVDGGGTAALFSGGGYKVGPGRAMPNAIVFKHR